MFDSGVINAGRLVAHIRKMAENDANTLSGTDASDEYTTGMYVGSLLSLAGIAHGIGCTGLSAAIELAVDRHSWPDDAELALLGVAPARG